MALIPLFPQTYVSSRARFRANLRKVQSLWPQARLESHALEAHPDLTIDWIWADARETPRHRVIVSAGEHGVEGYVGSAMLQVFIERFLPWVNPDDTGLLLVHGMNPWGMANFRRVNPNNVDLNRNFLAPDFFARSREAVNPDYATLNHLLNPSGEVRSYTRESLRWRAKVLKALISPGEAALRAATLLGQYRFPKGIYYGGDAPQEETGVMMALCRQAWRGYERITHVDIHTGYGPRGQMTIVNSLLEARTPESLKKAFDYPYVVTTEPGEFYTIHGDMMDWVYRTLAQEDRDVDAYSATFEFGTLGAGTLAGVRSLQALVFENRAFWYGASEDARARIHDEFLALFYPQDAAWQRQAVAQAERAFAGILRARGVPVP